MPKTFRLGTLGGAATFAGEATISMRALYPEFGEPAYFPSMDDCWDALKAGLVDVLILGSERTGQPHHGHPVVRNGWYVLGELTQPLGCNLYVLPGTVKSKVRRITGHGSTHQCVAWLEREFPGVPRDLHRLNSMAAGKEALGGDGTTAVVGTRSLRNALPGLELMAVNIDDGALSSWWAISDAPLFSERPRTLIVTRRCGPDGTLGDLVVALTALEFRLTTVAAFPVEEGISIYDYLLSFAGEGERSEIERALSAFPGARLAGAFEPRTRHDSR